MLRLSLRASSTIRHGFGVVGAGQMGTGIAIVAALKNVGPKIYLIDKFPEQIAKAKLFCETWVAKEIAKNRILSAKIAFYPPKTALSVKKKTLSL